ncbi:MAG: FAD:protein FMN transferase [Gammaproteobacteria bacterium]
MLQEEHLNRGFMYSSPTFKITVAAVLSAFRDFLVAVAPLNVTLTVEVAQSFASRVSLKACSFLLLCALGGCDPGMQSATGITSLRGTTMASTYSVKVAGLKTADIALPPNSKGSTLAAHIESLLEDFNLVFSTYDPASELSRLNARREVGEQQISKALWDLLLRAKQVSELSDGAFDVTIAPLVNLWGFGPDTPSNFVEMEKRLDSVLEHCGSALYSLPRPGVLVKHDENLMIDLSAIAKGHAVDKVYEYLHKLGIENFLIEIGGEVRARGSKPDNRPWIVGIEKPLSGSRQIGWKIALNNMAMASSGDYRNYFEHAGQRYSHLVDPRDGRPIQSRDIGVTVIAEEAAMADAWATTLAVLGVEEGLGLANRHGVAVQFVIGDNSFRSAAFEKLAVTALPGLLN